MKHIFGEYREVGHTLNQHILIPSLTKIELQELPSFIGMVRESKICTQRSSCEIGKDDSKEKQTMPFSRAFGCFFLPTTKDIDIEVSSSSSQNPKATKESYRTSSKRIETFHTAECLIRQPLSLQNIREMRLRGCSKLKSLFSVSIASTIVLEMLEIINCEELKHIITNDEVDDDHLNYTSIFPELERLRVFNCHNLEFIFPFAPSGGLQKLQIMEIKDAHLLKYIFGAYDADQNINLVPINLPALKTLALTSVPEIIGLCTNNYYVVWPSLQHITLGNCWGLIRSTLPDFMASHHGRQLDLNIGKGGLITGSSFFPDIMICLQSRQPNMETYEDYKKITMSMQNLISLEVGQSETIEEIFNAEGIQSEGPVTLSLQEMKLQDLGELRHIYKDPNNILRLLHLKDIQIKGCGKLRALFTTSTVKSLPRLSYLSVSDCKELVHIIEEDDNDETSASGGGSHQLCFPMLEKIGIHRCDGLKSLFSITTTTTMLPNSKTLYIRRASTLEEIFNVEGLQSEGPVTLSLQKMYLEDMGELRHIYKDPNNILRLLHLKDLKIRGCGKLRAVFTNSTTESLPRLSSLEVSDCKELVHIIEEDDNDETSASGGGSHQLCFPMLERIKIRNCDGLGSLFSISTTSTMLPNLQTLYIREAARLEEVFRCQQYDPQEMSAQNVFPNLFCLQLLDLKELRTVCRGINFDSLPIFEVEDCLKFKENESPTVAELYATDCDSDQAMSNFKEAKLEQEIETQELATSASPNFTETKLINGQQRTEQDLVDQLNSREATSGIKVPHQANIGLMEEAVEQTFQEQDGSKEVITPTNSNKGLHHSLEPGKEVVGIATASTSTTVSKNSKDSETGNEAFGTLLTSGLSTATTSSNVKSNIESIPEDTTTMKGKISTPPIFSQAEGLQTYPTAQVAPSIEGTLKQGPQQNYAAEEVTIANKSIDLDPKKKSILGPKGASKDISKKVSALGTSSKSIMFHSEFTNKEIRNASDLEGHKAEKATEANPSTQSQSYSPNTTKHNTILADVILPLQHQPQIGVSGSSSPTLEIGEIIKLVELKESEQALLTNALERYPKLKLPRERRTNRIIDLSYRVIVDILIMLTTKTPCTFTASDRSILEDNLGEAMILGFDNEWIESVRAKISGSDTLNFINRNPHIMPTFVQ